MFRLSAEVRYGLRAMAYLAHQKRTCPLNEIAEKEKIPAAFLEKILSSLRRADLIVSKKGAAGGYLLKAPPDEITIRQIMEALGEPLSLVDCLDKEGNQCLLLNRCSARSVWGKMQKKLLDFLNSTKLSDLK